MCIGSFPLCVLCFPFDNIEAILEAGEAKAKEKKIIKFNSLSSARIENPINTIEGVKEYIRKLEDEMTKKVNEGYTVE